MHYVVAVISLNNTTTLFERTNKDNVAVVSLISHFKLILNSLFFIVSKWDSLKYGHICCPVPKLLRNSKYQYNLLLTK